MKLVIPSRECTDQDRCEDCEDTDCNCDCHFEDPRYALGEVT